MSSTADGHSATTDASGHYSLSLPVGTYDVTAAAFGYASKTVTGVVVADGQTVSEPFALAAVPSHTVSGTITDGSGQGWPIYAKITVQGAPVSTYSDPFTGHYSLALPAGSTYTIHAVSQYPGYLPTNHDVTVGDTDARADLQALVDPSTCAAKGYAFHYDGTSEDFTGWTGTTPQDGWTITDAKGNGQTWGFDNPGNRAAPAGSDGDFAIIDSDHFGSGNSQDSSLVSPVVDLSAQTAPELGLDTDYNGISGQVADVDLSTDGGTTWTNVWERTTDDLTGHLDIPLQAAAGQSAVQVRFHFTATWGWWWIVDNAFVGTRTCVATGGGLVAGIVRDGNTHQPLNGAKVASDAHPDEFGVSAATPDDPALADGFYWLYSSQHRAHDVPRHRREVHAGHGRGERRGRVHHPEELDAPGRAPHRDPGQPERHGPAGWVGDQDGVLRQRWDPAGARRPRRAERRVHAAGPRPGRTRRTPEGHVLARGRGAGGQVAHDGGARLPRALTVGDAGGSTVARHRRLPHPHDGQRGRLR